MPAIGSRRRPKLQGIVDRWVGINQRSAVASSTNTALSSSSSPNPQHRPQRLPAKKTKNQPTPPRRPVKRASYAGHELSSPSDLNAEANTNGSAIQSNYKYHVEALDDDDQATTITEQTDELTMFTNNGSTNTFVSLENQFQNMLIHNSCLHPHQTFLGLQPQQKMTTRRCSAPPLLDLTVETPSPPPKNMSPTSHNHQDEVEIDPQNMAHKKSPSQNVPRPNGSTTKKEDMQAQDTATTVAGTATTNPTALDSSVVANITAHVPILRKQVSLNPKTRIYLHLHLADFSQEEYNTSFLTNEDMNRIQLENVNTISHLRSQKNNHENQGGDEEENTSSEYTARGLEIMSSIESVQAHQQTKQAAIDAVMDQQDEQFDGEYCDHDRIAKVYMAETSGSVRAACIRGASDATYVNRFVRGSHG